MEMKDHLNGAVYTLKRSAIREFSKLAAGTPGCIRLTLGEPDFDTPAPIGEAAAAAIAAGDTHYIENNGAADLREAIAAFEKEQNGLDYSEGEIIVTAGATEALFTALFGIIEPGDEVIIPIPAFSLYEEIVKMCRGKAVHLDTSKSGFQIREEDLEPLITDKTKAIILNSPNNPTGCVYDKESLDAVGHLIYDRPIFVICDDVYRQLCYTDGYHSFAEFGTASDTSAAGNEAKALREQIIVIQSFSKPYAMTGWRVGYLMADASVKERLELVHQFTVVSTPAPFQKACIEALSYSPKPMLEEYSRRRDYVIGRLRGMGLEIEIPEGAFYAFPSVKKYGLAPSELAQRLVLEAGVAVTPGEAFGSDEHIRISYCCSMADLEEGLNRLESFLGGLQAE